MGAFLLKKKNHTDEQSYIQPYKCQYEGEFSINTTRK